MASSSFSGRVRVFSMSRYEESVLIPGVAFSVGICGAGGGGGNGDVDLDAAGDGDVVGATCACGIGGMGTNAFDFNAVILSLYASFSSLISLNPSLHIES